MEGLARSAASIFWVMVALVAFMYFFAILFVSEVKHEIFAGPEVLPEASACEQDPFFCDLNSAMNTMLDVVVGAQWSDIARPLTRHQSYLMPPFILFFVIACFGVVNVIIGVIVDATMDTKIRIEWQRKRDILRQVSGIWQQ